MKTVTISEWCSNCQHEVELVNEFEKQQCLICKKEILPCAQCESQNCSKCPLEI